MDVRNNSRNKGYENPLKMQDEGRGEKSVKKIQDLSLDE